MKKTFLSLAVGLFSATVLFAQSNPTPFALSSGSYSLTAWDADAAAETYPANMIFHRTAVQDPTLTATAATDYVGAYNLISGPRFNGLGEDGFSFINTGTSGNLGMAVLALNAEGRENIQVSWVAGTVVQNLRTYRVRLQYRTSTTADWTDAPGLDDYESNIDGHSQTFDPYTLPAICNNQVGLQIRWFYYYVSGSGARAQIRIDNILVTSSALTTVSPIIEVSPSALDFNQTIGAPSASQPLSIAAVHLTDPLYISIEAPFEMALSEEGPYTVETVELTPSGDGAISQTIFVRLNADALGAYSTDISFSSTDATTETVALTGKTNESVIVPVLFINELMSSNETTAVDEYDEFDDWVEIYNPNDFDVNMAGFYLTDNLSSTMKYRIPEDAEDAIVPAKGYLIIWADNQSVQGNLHTNFALSASGESFGIYFSDGTLIDSISFGAIPTDQSFGRVKDGDADWKIFETPTFNATNFIDDTPTSLPKHLTGQLTVYPNPANERLYFSAPCTFVIYNINGEQVAQGTNTNLVSTKNLQTGLYLVKTQEGQTFKISVAR